MSHYGRMTTLSFLTDPRFFIGVAVLVAVLRIKPDDLLALVLALMGMGCGDDGGRTPPSLPRSADDGGPTPPSLPEP
jgi:hypothetical protein